MSDFPSFLSKYRYDRKVFVSSLQQRFTLEEPEIEMIDQDQYWSFSIPHESSGPCYTYDPPKDSDPGYVAGMYLIMNATEWDPNLEIFFHKKGKFFYQDADTYNTERIDQSRLKKVLNGHPRISGKTNKKIVSYSHNFRIAEVVSST